MFISVTETNSKIRLCIINKIVHVHFTRHTIYWASKTSTMYRQMTARSLDTGVDDESNAILMPGVCVAVGVRIGVNDIDVVVSFTVTSSCFATGSLLAIRFPGKMASSEYKLK